MEKIRVQQINSVKDKGQVEYEKKRNAIFEEAKRQNPAKQGSEFLGLTTDFTGYPMLSQLPKNIKGRNSYINSNFCVTENHIVKSKIKTHQNSKIN